MQKKIHIFLIMILGFLIYANSLSGRFIWDDKTTVVDNTYIKNPANIFAVFFNDISAGAKKKSDLYRPTQTLTYMWDYYFWQLNPFGYHLTNILLHILAALCLYRLAGIIFKDFIIAFIAALFFLAHPVHTEAVSYISGRNDSIAAVFFLLSFILYIKDKSSNKEYLYPVLFYILALVSRESVLILPFCLLLYNYIFKTTVNYKKLVPILIITFLYILLRLFLLPPLAPSLLKTTLLARLPGFFVALATYLRLLILPFNLHMEYGQGFFSFLHPLAITGALVLFLFFLYFFFGKKNIIFFCIVWFFLALAPVSNLYPLNAFMAEHWLYIPSIGFFLIVSKLLRDIYSVKGFKKTAVFITISLLCFYSILTIKQNNYWKDSIVFYERTLRYNPGSARILYNLGNAYRDSGRYPQAIEALQSAIKIDSSNAMLYDYLGMVYGSCGQISESQAAFKQAIRLNPSYAQAYGNLGALYRFIGKDKEALPLFIEAIKLDYNNPVFFNHLGSIWSSWGRYEEAINAFNRAIEIKKDYVEAFDNLALTYYAKKQYNLAVNCCRQASNLKPKNMPRCLKILDIK